MPEELVRNLFASQVTYFRSSKFITYRPSLVKKQCQLSPKVVSTPPNTYLRDRERIYTDHDHDGSLFFWMNYFRQYPTRIYEYLAAYSSPLPGGTNSHCIDLGCGPGLATLKLAESLKCQKITGIDPGSGMISRAKEVSSTSDPSNSTVVEFKVGSAEESLKDFKDGSISFVGAFQAAHWFDHKSGKLHQELERVLMPGGTVAWVGYGEMFFVERQEMSELVDGYVHGTLGRSLTEDLLRSIPFPSNTSAWDVSSFTRVVFDAPGSATYNTPPLSPQDSIPIKTEPLVLTHDWTPKNFLDYLGTFSSAHTYDEMFGLRDGKGVADEWFEKVKKRMGVKEGEEEEVKWKIGWPVGMMLFKKKAD